MNQAEHPFLELNTHTGVLSVLSPAGIVLHELRLMEQVQLFQMLFNAHVQAATGQIQPGTVLRITRGGGAPPMQVVEPVNNPTA